MSPEKDIWFQLEKVYREGYGALLVYAIRIVGDVEKAKDSVQDAMLSLFRRLPSHIEGDFFKYVMTSVKNKCISRLYHEERMKKRDRRYSIDLEQFESFEFEFRGGKFMEFCLSNLTLQQSEVLQLQLVHEMPQKEIASKMGITEKAVSQSKYFALKRIKQYVETGKFRQPQGEKSTIFKK